MTIYSRVKCKHTETKNSAGVLICKNCRKVLGASKQVE